VTGKLFFCGEVFIEKWPPVRAVGPPTECLDDVASRGFVKADLCVVGSDEQRPEDLDEIGREHGDPLTAPVFEQLADLSRERE
jgi:hypothetical protein